MAAALLGAGYVFAVVLQLNPALSLDPLALAPIALTVTLFYATNLTALFFACLVLRDLFAREPFSPSWLSVTALSRLGAAAAALFVVIGTLHAQSGSRFRRSWALLLAVVAVGSIAVPIAIRGRGVPDAPRTRLVDATGDVANILPGERSSHVTILAIDAASLELITNATADGRLPNFGRLLDAGAVMHLATIHPTSAEAVWAAAATGKLPQKNGVRSLGTYRLARFSTGSRPPDAERAHRGEPV